MSTVQVLIIEDEALYAGKIEMQLDKLGYQHLATLDNSKAALDLLAEKQPDLIIMDINIKGEYDGIELADIIQQKQAIPIIFITSQHDDLTFRRANRTNPIGFLTKPFTEIQLRRSIELTISQLAKNTTTEDKETIFSEDHFFIKSGQQLDKIVFDDIVYLEANGRYINIITKQRKYLLRRSLQEMIGLLGSKQFAQTHRSYAGNLKLVTNVDLLDYTIHLGEHRIPLSKRNKEDFLKRLEVI